MGRGQLVANVLSDSPDAPVRPWHRVALVSGAGLGKTANLQWLAARVNKQDDGRGRQVAIFTPLRDLPASGQELPEFVYQWLIEHYGQNTDAREVAMLKELALRLLKQGRVLFLLDSLDEAGAAENSPAITKLRQLISSTWKQNPVWVSGRPYAFRATERALREMSPQADWNFVRIGPLNEPEARQLVETAGRV
jgi:predicted NACHT family NTPase